MPHLAVSVAKVVISNIGTHDYLWALYGRYKMYTLPLQAYKLCMCSGGTISAVFFHMLCFIQYVSGPLHRAIRFTWWNSALLVTGHIGILTEKPLSYAAENLMVTDGYPQVPNYVFTFQNHFWTDKHLFLRVHFSWYPTNQKLLSVWKLLVSIAMNCDRAIKLS